jgi:hypothetical protein
MTAIRRSHSYQRILIQNVAQQLRREQNTLWFKAKRALRKSLRNLKAEDVVLAFMGVSGSFAAGVILILWIAGA